MLTFVAVQSSCAFASLNHLDQALQWELAAWATLEADHRSACGWLEAWSGPKEVKEHLTCRLEARHRTEREAHVLRLADLHQQRTLLVMAETLEPTDEVSGGSGADQDQSKLPRMLPSAWMISSPDHGRASPQSLFDLHGTRRTSAAKGVLPSCGSA
jgi:hypothetical protein